MSDHDDGEEKKLSLDNMARGAIVERFNDGLESVLENLIDLNTDPEAVRKMVQTTTFKADEDRTVVVVSTKIELKLAAARPINTIFYVGVKNGRPVAREYNPKQMTLEEAAEAELRARNVTDIKKVN